MSTRRPAARPHPRTPPSPGVFWRRRAMVAGTAVLLVVATVDLVNGDGSVPADTVQQVVGTPTGGVSDPGDPATAKVRTGKGKKKNRKNQPTEPAEPVFTPPPPAEPDGACADDDVTVTPVMGLAVAGRPVLVSLVLQTRESAACT